MLLNRYVKFFLIISLIIILTFFGYKKFIKKDEIKIEDNKSEDVSYNSNIIQDVNYTTIDPDGNEYIINALQGEIDFSNPNILYLTQVKAIIRLNNSEDIIIVSDFGKYNSENFDTIFSKNVIINYLQNKITGEYLDFSLQRNSMIISREVTYNNLENILKADVIELNIKTKDTKIFMYEEEKKVNIQNKK